ncbi:MAG: enoyl-CoA hydratase-related protein [Acidimicrobiia bacterium]
METITLDRAEPHVTIVTLNRPERLNAMSFALVAELHDALDEIAGDADCKVVVMTGAGRGFCAGLDLKDWGTPPGPGEHRHVGANTDGQAFMSNLTVHLRTTPQVVVAAVNGPAFGGGFALACACDLRFASTSATFCSAFIRTGLTGTDIGITYLLPRLIGASRAADLILTGREIDAEEAREMGVVSRVVDDDRLLDEALTAARTMAGYTRTGLLNTKEVLWHNVDTPSMTAAIALENRNQSLAGQAADVREFMAHYRDRATGGS